MKREPLPVDDATLVRLATEAKTMRDDVIALRFYWTIPFLHDIARRYGIALTTQEEYLAKHPAIAERDKAAAEVLGNKVPRRKRNDPHFVPRIRRPHAELRDYHIMVVTTDTIGNLIAEEATRRDLKRGSLLGSVIEKIAIRNLWAEILK